jgi:hypothetical protein
MIRQLLVRLELVVSSQDLGEVEAFLRQIEQRGGVWRMRVDSHPPESTTSELPAKLQIALRPPRETGP